MQTPPGRLTLLLFHNELGEPTGPIARRLRGAGHLSLDRATPEPDPGNAGEGKRGEMNDGNGIPGRDRRRRRRRSADAESGLPTRWARSSLCPSCRRPNGTSSPTGTFAFLSVASASAAASRRSTSTIRPGRARPISTSACPNCASPGSTGGWLAATRTSARCTTPARARSPRRCGSSPSAKG